MLGVFFLLLVSSAAGFYYLSRILAEVRCLRVDQTEILQRLEAIKRRMAQLEKGAAAQQGIPPPAVQEEDAEPPAVRPLLEPPPVPRKVVAAYEAAPPVAAPPPYGGDDEWVRPRSRVAESVAAILNRMWNWFLVGEEFRRPGVSAEVAIASTWLLRLFVLALGGAVASFIPLAIRRHLLPPEAVVSLVFAAGGLLIWAGVKLIGRKYSLIGHGLMGGGILVCYLGAYAAGPSSYSLFGGASPVSSFTMMVVVAVLSACLAVRTDSLLAAIFGIAGAFGAPLILKTAQVNFAGLYGYLLILNLTVLAIAMKKEWRLLNYISFVLTYLLFTASLDSYRGQDFLTVIIFLGLFFVVNSSLVFLRNLIDEKESTVLEVLHMTANALLFAYFAFTLVDDRFGRPHPAIVTSLLAAFYAGHAYVFLRKSLVDPKLIVTFSALSCLFLTLTLPVVVEKESLTMCFALLALMFLWIGRKIESNFIQSIGNVLYMIVLVRLLYGLCTGFAGDPSRKMLFSDYTAMMFERLWKYGVSVASLIGACMLQRSNIAVRHDFAVTMENDTPEVIRRHLASDIFYWTGVLVGFVFLLLEANAVMSFFKPVRQTALTGLWVVIGLYFMISYFSFRKRDAFAVSAMNAFALVAAVKLVFLDLAGWRLNHRWVYGSAYDALDASLRALDFALVIAMFYVIWRVMSSRKSWIPAAVFGYWAMFLVLLYSTLELNSFMYFRLREFQHGGISVLWSLFAMAFVGAGIRKDLKLMRYTGLALFAVVAVKVPVLDLASMELFYRMLAFLVIAAAMLGGSFAYLHSGTKAAPKSRV